MRTERRTSSTTLLVAFRNFVTPPLKFTVPPCNTLCFTKGTVHAPSIYLPRNWWSFDLLIVRDHPWAYSSHNSLIFIAYLNFQAQVLKPVALKEYRPPVSKLLLQKLRSCFQMADPDDEEEGNEPLDISWPDTTRKRITYLLVAPIVFPLWMTLPDTRTPRGKTPTSSSTTRNYLIG